MKLRHKKSGRVYENTDLMWYHNGWVLQWDLDTRKGDTSDTAHLDYYSSEFWEEVKEEEKYRVLFIVPNEQLLEAQLTHQQINQIKERLI